MNTFELDTQASQYVQGPNFRELLEECHKAWKGLGFIIGQYTDLKYTDTQSFFELSLTCDPDPRRFFICRTTRELLNITASIHQWTYFAETFIPTGDQLSNQAHIDSIYKHQSAVVRKLIDIFTYCKQFEETKHNHFFEHFLLAMDLQQHLDRIQDSKQFWGQQGKFLENRCKSIEDKILALELKHSELKNAWYLKNSKSTVRFKNLNNFFSSSRVQLINVWKKLTPTEQLMLGYSYSAIFGSTSRHLHFMPSIIYSSPPPTQ